MLAPIPEILEDLKRGKMVILVDDEDRENEGDLVAAAELITPQQINFMTKHTPGYLCVALSGADCDRLDLHPQTSLNTALRGTAMAVSVDGHPKHGVGTGISASDRAKTARLIASPDAQPDDLVRPGHLVPLRARDGGVLVRTGQTEGSVDLMRLSGLRAAAVISEISRPDGEMARMPELVEFAKTHDLKICSVEQIIHHRLERERLIHRIEPQGGTQVETDFGAFNLIAYDSLVDPLPHIALTLGGIGDLDPAGHPIEHSDPVLVRVHRRNLLGDIFGDRSQPTNRTLARSLEMIQREGRGAFIYLRPSGVGEGLLGRLQTLREGGPRDANQPDLRSAGGVGSAALPMDQRDFGIGGQILRDLGLTNLRIMTNNPRRMTNLRAFGLEVVETLPVDPSV
ncbi:MAG: 3,4-dihydroxy-2-butanone-4-phosphate synthase [Phycisphaerales bacterium]